MSHIGQGELSEEIFAERLARNGYVSAAELVRARSYQTDRGCPLGQALIELGLLPERTIAQQFAEFLALPVATANDYPELPVLPDSISTGYLRRYAMVPIADSDSLSIAMANPLDGFAKQAFQLLAQKPVRPLVGVYSEIEAALDRLYGNGSAAAAEAEDAPEAAVSDELETRRLMESAQEAPVVRYVNSLITRAVEVRASDIHCEPSNNQLHVRIRIDGVLQEVEPPSPALSAAVSSRIKIMARLNIAERRLPQDGRIRMSIKGAAIDMRVSAIPTLHGERLVLRILDNSSGPWSLEQLGLSVDTQAGLRKLLARPNGMLLVTGPTGSGKTTTLYAALSSLPAAQKNILTVEDPIEYQIAGISQVQVKAQIGLTFASVLRSMLRQDPDIVMVGEIRDSETAEIAVNAALTGHLVLTTLHTNTAAATVARLLDMGVPSFLLSSALEGVLSQRLVRRLCDKCKAPAPVRAELLAGAGDEPAETYRAVGCPSCHGTGYSGRIAISELMVPTDELRRLMVQNESSHAIHQAAVAAGMRPLWNDGIEKVLSGQTTIDEVLQAVKQEGS
jgi:general secretion pathway protein E